ncbi:Small-conductance mechanosensitive channel [Oryzisolibacter propanilivorax]|uniref:Small-conductance mechanosensitive channel n=1 Tax=Oryzisolibacter propanilivorax TaxID=1527607 RepID=A0A1G9QA00_9BURK|nr:mechanosensitive ion channel family protein [Oryzisolibacter propanilivorax]SDM07175.1 Small-conductance mechanosensitive channel [Oryzisolibacter propanilivorax]
MELLPDWDWLHAEGWWGISPASALVAVAAMLVTYVLLTLALRWGQRRARQLQERPGHSATRLLARVLAGTSQLLILLAALLVGLGFLDLPDRWHNRVSQLWFIAVALQIGLWGSRAIAVVVERYRAHHGNTGPNQVSASGTLMSWALRTLLWVTVLLSILANLGVNITAFIASLGVGGVAVALAVQNILADLFASMAIAVDKPFEVGDFIVVGGVAGTVQKVGVKTTRIKALSGEQVVMGNTDLLKQTINNYRVMRERRIVFAFSIAQSTPPEKAAAVSQAVAEIIQGVPQVRFDRAHFKGFGASSLDYEVVYIVEDPGYNLYMDIQQRINLELLGRLQVLDVQLAVPVSRVQVASGQTGVHAQGVPAQAETGALPAA